MLGAIRLGAKPACMVIKGPTDALVFREYIRKILGPTLHPGDIVICDNLSAHRDEEARKLIESRQARLVFLPAYSPDLNPIEAMCRKSQPPCVGPKPGRRKAYSGPSGKPSTPSPSRIPKGSFVIAAMCAIYFNMV